MVAMEAMARVNNNRELAMALDIMVSSTNSSNPAMTQIKVDISSSNLAMETKTEEDMVTEQAAVIKIESSGWPAA